MDHMINKTVHIKPVWGIVVSMALLFSIVAFMLALTGVAAPCNFAQAQVQCSVGDDETFTGPATFEDEINLGATPVPGTAGFVAVSGGANTPVEWNDNRTFFKAVNENVTASTALQDDNDFTFTANTSTTYSFEMLLVVTGDAGGDLDFGWTVPASWTIHGNTSTNLAGPTFASFTETGETTLQTTGIQAAYSLTGVFDGNGLAAGTITFRWAQNASQATNTVIERGSWMKIKELG